MYQLKFQGAFGIPGNEEVFVINLTDVNEQRSIAVLAGSYTASLFKDLEVGDKRLQRTLSYVLISLLQKSGELAEYKVRLYSLKDTVIKAELVNMITDEHKPIAPDEAVLLAVMAKLEMYTDKETMLHFSTPYSKGAMQMALPIAALPDNMLKKALAEAVAQEQYESASVIRDEMKRRNLKA